jgi:hypothetical protein
MKRGFVTMLVLLAAGQFAFAQGKDGPSVILKPAKAYMELWVAGRTCEGLDTCWDVDGTFKDLFGRDYADLPESDRSYLRHLFVVFITASNRLPGVAETVKEAKVSLDRIELPEEGRAVARGTIETGGDKRPFHLVLIKKDEGWKIINVGHGGSDLTALKPIWEQFKKINGKNSLVIWWEGMSAELFTKLRPQPKEE